MTKISNLYTLTNYISANSSGNVVIAAPASGYALDVTGTGRFTGALSGTSATFSGAIQGNGLTLLNSSGTYANWYVSSYLIGRIGNVDTNDMYYDSTFGGNHIFRTGTGGTTSPSNKMIITSAGNVGIGTTLPQDYSGFNVLHINGKSGSNGGVLRLTAFDNSSSANIYAAGSAINFNTTSAVPFIWFTQDTERMRITSGGQVGIGTTSPSVALEVVSAIRATNSATSGFASSNIQLAAYNGSTVAVSGSIFQTSSTFAYQQIAANQTNIYGTAANGIRIATANAPIIFNTGNSDADFSTERMRITSGGQVGIGTTSILQTFTLAGTQMMYNTAGDGNTNTVIGSITSQVRNYGTNIATNSFASIQFATDPSTWYKGDIRFLTNGSDGTGSAATERMRITSAGKLAIGMTNADYGVVSIKSNSSTSYYGLNVYANSNDRFIVLNHTGSEGVIETENAGSGVFTDMMFKTGASERMRIYSDGRIRTTVNGVNGQFQLHQTNSGYNTDAMMYLMNNRNATSSYNFAKFFSGYPDNSQDIEFNFRGDGVGFSDGGWTSPASDYAEYFESSNGQSLPIGSTVVLEDGKIRLATQSDTNIIGVIRPKNAALFLGNNADSKWNQKYIKDDFGAYVLDSEGMRTLNPAYDSSYEYIPREKRSEWNIVGLVGQVPILKSQPVGFSWVKMYDVSSTVEMWLIK